MSGATNGIVRIVLRLEGLSVLAMALICYSKFGAGWGLFVACFLIPDLSLLGYVVGSKTGAVTYNMAHSYLGPIACLFAGAFGAIQPLITAGLIWCAHIGFDRALGYGLKYSKGFSFTHLGLVGRLQRKASNTSLNQDGLTPAR
ncbi:DUF4260 domain-containing protein [Jeongeupia chitinilytica]|uniref:DUF4260 domain-containing protein n=1 Tax=Jeongeupia chitinilytica TaxID=1041641 RepID=UPI0016778478